KRRSGLLLLKDNARPIPRRSSREPVSLSSTQRGLWMLDVLRGQTPLCNLYEAFRLSGPLNLDALRHAIQVCFRRHEVLGARITGTEAPRLEVMAEVELPYRVVDLSDQDAAEAEERALQLANEQAATAFDIGRAPLARVTLLRIGAQLHLLVVVVHHLIAD